MTSSVPRTAFEVNVIKDTFKFTAAHFVAFPGFRERLHGHNYTIGIRLLGSRKIGQDGYVLDFGDVKKAAKDICKRLNEHFICPMYSDVLQMTVLDGKGDETEATEGTLGVTGGGTGTVKLVCEDGAEFSFPRGDCAMLPIVHSTAEELAIYCWGKMMMELDAKFLLKRGIHTMAVTCAEAPGQEAVFRMEIPENGEKEDIQRVCDVRSYIMTGELFPKPCLPVDGEKNGVLKKTGNGTCCPNCGK